MREHFNSSNNNDCSYIRDYLGNVRSVIDASGNLVEVNDYYPYGTLMNTLADNPSQQPYKYGAKELDRTAGLDLYDSRARQYDPLLGRTTTVDPHSSAYFPTSHYAWCAGNPVSAIDPSGKNLYLLLPNGQMNLLYKDEADRDLIMSLKFNFFSVPKSFFESETTRDFEYKNNNETFYGSSTYYRADENSENLFVYLSENTDVEFTRFSTDQTGAYIGTSHNSDTDGTLKVLRENLSISRPNILEYDHKHYFMVEPSEADIITAKDLEKESQNSKCRIYEILTRRWIEYNSSSPFYSNEGEHDLNEVVVTAEKTKPNQP